MQDRASAASRAKGQAGKIPLYHVNPVDGTELVLVPGGWFWMGSEDSDQEAISYEKPYHLHHVPPFYMAIACVTVAQFKQFVEGTGHKNDQRWDKDPDSHPVRYVSWDDASAYAEWAGLRLPTQAEWELCARGYGALRYPWGDSWEKGRRLCWTRQKGPKGNTAPVHTHPDGVSQWGSFQQSGNLMEWCRDGSEVKVYERYAAGDFGMPDGGRYRVLRGGSWNGDVVLIPNRFRGAAHASFLSDYRSDEFGFRLARTWRGDS